MYLLLLANIHDIYARIAKKKKKKSIKIKIKVKKKIHTRPFSLTFVSITTVSHLSSHIILQKSFTVCFKGP